MLTENSACVLNYGCQMNIYESLALEKMLKGAGFELISSADQAEIVILNTCTVRDHADTKVFNRLKNLVPQKKKFRKKRIGVMGCMVEPHRQRLLQTYPEIDFLLSPQELSRIPHVLRDITARDFEEYSVYEYIREGENAPLKSFLPIQRGCNLQCSYCIVPAAKGAETNFSAEEIFLRLDNLVANGVRDITLLGQTINSYRWGSLNFSGLLEQVARRFPETWIRFLTSHPAFFDSKLIEVLGEFENLAPYVHLPAQSGSTRVLKHMKRGYSRKRYIDLISDIRAKIPGVVLSTDMICGYPTESEDEFEESLSLLDEVRFDTAYMFFYSERQGTRAAKSEGALDLAVRKDRLKRMIDIQMNFQKQSNLAQVGRRHWVLIDSRARKGASLYKGYTFSNLPVVAEGNEALEGQRVQVEITGATSHTLQANLVPSL
jgi:tRNA-2-methylthio-N6-dimethylallyladenosine synthase